MKKWLVALTIICGAGFLTSASLAGKIYFQGANIYTDYDKKNIDLTNINNIYINSDIPVEIKPTTGEAYVEFNQNFEDILGKNPEFELTVENKDKSCYINLNQTKDIEIWFMIKKDEAALTVYLPTKALDTLQINHESYRRWNYEIPQIDLTGIDIKNLEIAQNYTAVSLDGKYENIDITSGGSSTVKINSKQKANVRLEGEATYTLDGLFETVQINGRYEPIKINTLEPAKVNIEAYRSNIKLEGSYSSVKVLGDDNVINVKTATLSDIDITNTYGNIVLDGPLNMVKVNNECSEIDIQTTTNPKSIEVSGEQNNTVLRLPSNIPGFKIMYMQGNTNDYGYEMNQDGEYIQTSRINSDFTLNKVNNNTYTYGDSSSKLMLEVESGLRIVDNGYMSAK
nr:hypothetical protein [uncultured Cellulosilyticum sp.]